MPAKITTIEELERYTYGQARTSVSKADNPLLTTTGGINNPIYGAYAWIQVNQEANAFGILPKDPWDISGWRMVEDKATLNTNNGNSALGGTSEGGQIAEATKPNFNQTFVYPKIHHLPFQTSTVREWLASNSNDDFYGNGLEAMRMLMAIRHKEMLNQAILADSEKQAADAAGAYAGSKDWETFDRIVSSNVEENMLGGTHSTWYDPWTKIDRDGSSTYDCTVDSASGTIGTNGILTDDVIRGWRKNLLERSGKDSTVYLGGYDSLNEIQGIYTSQVRYDVLGKSTMKVDVNGIETFDGIGVGIQVSSVYGVPFIVSKDAPDNADDSTEVGRVFGFDTSDYEGYGKPRISIQIAQPTQYNEIGSGMAGFPFVLDKFAEEGVYWTMGETICRSFKAQSKLRDIRV